MIQILGYREYFDKGKQSWALKQVFFKPKAKSVPDLFQNLNNYLSQIPEEERYNLHYTLARCHDNTRVFIDQTTIPFDFDDIDLSKKDIYLGILEEVLQVPIADMGIVCSGRGLHVLMEVAQTFTSEEELTSYRPAYKVLLDKMDKKIKEAGLPGEMDKGVLRKSGTMRLPGTMNAPFPNAKPKDIFEAVPAYLINANVSTVNFNLLSFGPETSDHVSAQSLRSFPRPDTEFVLDECNFLKWNMERPWEVSEGEWYAALSIVGHLEDGRNLAHRMSAGDKDRYDYGATDSKLTQAMEASGPRTCQNIDTLSDKCKTCKHWGQITSPIMLRGPNFIKTIDTGFWEMKFDEKSNTLKPLKPAYEDLRRYFEKKYRYIAVPSGSVYVWEETRWIEMEEAFIKGFAQENFNPKPNNSHIGEFLGLVRRTNLRKEDWFTLSTEGKINLANGVLHLDSMELEPHDPKYGFRYCLNHGLDKAATSPRFDKFMQEITLGRKELQDVLMEYAAYSFAGMPYHWHKALMLSGEGSNGKSTFLSVLKKLAGTEAYSSLMLNELKEEYKRSLLMNKLFNVAEETPVRGLDDTSYFKILSAGGTYTAREIYKKPVTVTSNRTKLIMACNELPDLSDFSDGLARRLIIVPFEASFSGEAADPQLESKLESELPGILNRVIEAYQRLISQNGFTQSSIVKEAVSQYRTMQNSVASWFTENVQVDEELTGHVLEYSDGRRYSPKGWYETSTKLYQAYTEFCKTLSARPVSQTKFGVEIKRITGITSHTKKVDGRSIRVFEGIKFYDIAAGDF